MSIMTQRKRGPEPTPETRVDRVHVLTFVERTGRLRLVFSVRDVRSTLNDTPEIQLHRPRRLGNYIRDLDGDVIVCVTQGDVIREDRRTKGSDRRYVLKSRLHEYEAGARSLDDTARTYIALWIATEILQDAVRCADVGTVMANIPELLPAGGRDVSSRLSNLANLSDPLARVVGSAGPQQRLWEPLGPAPSHPKVHEWLDEAEALASSVGERRTLSDPVRNLMVEALVRSAVESKRRSWPGGHPVKASEIERLALSEPETERILGAVTRDGTGLGTALWEASRTLLSGTPRRTPLIERVSDPELQGVYYDIPDAKNRGIRRAFLQYKVAQDLASKDNLGLLEEEVADGVRLFAASPSPVRKAIGAARLLLAQGRWKGIQARVASLQEIVDYLPTQRRKAVRNMEARVRALARTAQYLEADPAGFIQILSEVGVSTGALAGASRPTLVAGELVEWLPTHASGRGNPGDFLTSFALERFPNTDYRGPNRKDPREVAKTAVDRVEALARVASRYQSPMTPLMDEVRRLLGPELRAPELILALANAEEPEDRRLGLVALAMTGQDSEARSRALHELSDPAVEYTMARAAVDALMITRRLDVDDLPEWLHHCNRIEIFELLRDAVMARNTGRWLKCG